jgi:ubiquinone/menaquinone biosynthesis C-methylase UbiE
MSNWNVLAKLDPLWTILSDPKKKFGKWEPAEFFATGKLEAERVLAMCDSNNVKISYGSLLDFGCGVGRMTRGFSGFFQSCTGIDVSENMVNLARNYNSDRSQCGFVASQGPILPFESESFDVVFTVLVLQHLPSKKAILAYIGEFIRIVKGGGVVIFQLPIEVPIRRRIQLRRRVWWLLSSVGIPKPWLFKVGLAPIQINGVSRQEVEEFIAKHGARMQAVERYDASEGEFHSNYYFVVKDPRPQNERIS